MLSGRRSNKPRELSIAQEHELVSTFLYYGIHCHSFHDGHRRLFPEYPKYIAKTSSYLERKLSHPMPQYDDSPVPRATILELIQERHKDLLTSVDARNRYHGSKTEQNQIQEIVNRGGQCGVVWRELKACKLRNSRSEEEARYLEHMASQGFPLLRHLESLDIYLLEYYTLQTFFEVTVTQEERKVGWTMTM
ncbi:hypothetical protein FGRMN_6899 [Fusarium graminum]|nr:hypothetical protein FGRMN_6899 [Fusarium graminum]